MVLSFVAMLMPAVACFSKLKRDKRHTYRHPLPAVYQTYVQSNKYPIYDRDEELTHTRSLDFSDKRSPEGSQLLGLGFYGL